MWSKITLRTAKLCTNITWKKKIQIITTLPATVLIPVMTLLQMCLKKAYKCENVSKIIIIINTLVTNGPLFITLNIGPFIRNQV